MTSGGAGPRALRHRGMLAVLATAATASVLLVSGCSGGRTAGQAAVGSAPAATSPVLPAFLPKASFEPDRVLTASAARPALTTEGDSIKIVGPAGSVLMTVTGPEVPGEGLPYQTAATTCTWTVSITGATARMPVTIADFTTLDHLGSVYRPTLVAGQPVPSAFVDPGQTVSFELRAVMRTGEGLMRWAPKGSTTLASWDFEVETD